MTEQQNEPTTYRIQVRLGGVPMPTAPIHRLPTDWYEQPDATLSRAIALSVGVWGNILALALIMRGMG